MKIKELRAPFPYFGGKSKIASLVWKRFGNVPNYVEPFFGSGAVLLGRPHRPGIETVNDKDGMLSNFWRSLQADSTGLAKWADWPVNENDLHARHIWLKGRRKELASKLEGDPDYYDVKIAGWWVWGICAWIGSGWCSDSGDGPWGVADGKLVHLGNAGRGINRKRVHLSNAGRGINRQLVHLGNAGQGINRKRAECLEQEFRRLADRLRGVRVCCGDWKRVCGPAPTVKQGVTGVFLDPPYGRGTGRESDLYSEDDLNVAGDVMRWALEHGDDPRMRIALCGYEGERQMPKSWECMGWKAAGGYGNEGNARGGRNAWRERIWFSPHCIRVMLL